ncbi:MAG: histone deacetylase [Planctomycetota bacterium]|nr:MAG: histone deacetylase [Planctomycetota bacterium]
MTLLYYDPLFLQHQTGTHPERPERLVQVMRHLERTRLDKRCRRPDWQPASAERLSRVHTPEYQQSVEAYCRGGGGRIEIDTRVSEKSCDAARLAAGAASDAVKRVVSGEDKQALCLVRPPGHHALHDAPMGFCLFNNVAVAAHTATDELDVNRVLIVDWDVHHGNGTQAAFWEDPRVAFLSIHRWPFYPGTGRPDETGTGKALGTKLNLPVEFGTAREAYFDTFRTGLERLAAQTKPELVIISAGFDAHTDDPVGSLGLETEDFARLTETVLDVADTYAGGKVVSVLEGGYNTGVLAGCVAEHLEGLLAREAGQEGS